MDDNKLAKAQEIYADICSLLEELKFRFSREDDILAVHFTVSGDDLPMELYLTVDAERQLIRILSPLPFKVTEDKRLDCAVAVCAATYELTDGSFDYNVFSGSIVFRATSTFRGESKIGEDLFMYLVKIACDSVDEYNDKFFAISKGLLSLEDFMASLEDE